MAAQAMQIARREMPHAGMRRAQAAIAVCLLAMLFAAGLLPAAAQTPKKDEFQTSAPYAILIEAESGAVLFERGADTLIAPSSMAKLMTAELVFHALREQRLKLDTEVSISDNAWRRGGASSGGSTMYAALHSRVRVRDLLRGIIVQSGNDACIAVAEAMAGNEATFAGQMTKRAREIGLPRSTFANATGLPDPQMRMTAREIAQLARHIIFTYPEFYPIYSEREFTWNKIRQPNRNPLLPMGVGADGLKTGYAKEAGYGLVGSAVQNNLRLILVVNGLKTARERADEARKLLDYGFRQFEGRLLFAEGEPVGEAKLYGGQKGHVPLVGEKPIKILLPRGSNDKITARIVYSGPVRAPVKEGQKIGRLKVFRGEQMVLDMPLQAAEAVAVGSVAQRAFDAATEIVISLFRAGAERI